MRIATVLLSGWLLVGAAGAEVADVEPYTRPDQVHFEGLVGTRLLATAEGRLLKMDEDALLAGFRRRPGNQAWCGEHVGKFLHAATLAWAYTGNPALRAKIDRVTAELLKTQLPDGYLGTYTPDHYWTSWDVWVHKYCLYGLMVVYEYTGNQAALAGARKIGDLMCRTFGRGKRDIIKSGTHVGMAATSIMEPMMRLYRATRDPRYLHFCEYLVWSWSQPHGPHLLKSLLHGGKVNETANGKAYEMMSNLVGLCELYRVTGRKDYLTACLNAWQDIVDNRMYLTGGVSYHEHFQADHHLPNTGDVSENCAQVTWLQLNAQLLRLTGEARFAEVLETLVYNHLFASQRPDGWAICYFTPLTGTKPYTSGINCCTSSNSRGVALIPTFGWSMRGRTVYANLHTPGRVKLPFADASLRQTADYPDEPRLRYQVVTKQPVTFTLAVRLPNWCARPAFRLNGKPCSVSRKKGYAVLNRAWRATDVFEVELPMPVERIFGAYENKGLVAIRRGPLVYALDVADNPGLPPLRGVGLAATAVPKVAPAPAKRRTWPGEQFVQIRSALAPGLDRGGPAPVLTLRPFADAGASGSRFAVWLPGEAAVKRIRLSRLSLGKETWSRVGNVDGSIIDGDVNTWRVTYDGTRQPEDWYAVTLPHPIVLNRIVYAHGHTYHDGGWFDASQGKPRIQARMTPTGPWETIAVLDAYPDTTATDSRGLRPGQTFAARFRPRSVYAVRIVGVGACGDNPNQCFSSCAELQGFGDGKVGSFERPG